MRDFAQIHQADGGRTGFGNFKNHNLAHEISHNLQLSIHKQSGSTGRVTTLDVAGAESVAHAVNIMRVKVASVPPDYDREEILKQVQKECNLLFFKKKNDMLVLDWLVQNYKMIPKITKESVLADNPQEIGNDGSQSSSDFS